MMNCVAGVAELLSLESCGHRERRTVLLRWNEEYTRPPTTLKDRSSPITTVCLSKRNESTIISKLQLRTKKRFRKLLT